MNHRCRFFSLLAFILLAAVPKPVFAQSAALAPKATDNDLDGITNAQDRCPGTPEGIVVDPRGCPHDSDADGTPNYRDNCPQTPAGRAVDKYGCKLPVRYVETIELKINFALDSSVIPAAYRGELEKLVKLLAEHVDSRVIIAGYTDNRGSQKYNQSLSLRRAEAVRDALTQDFAIAAERIDVAGHGEQTPVASNGTEAGRSANRRVMATIDVPRFR